MPTRPGVEASIRLSKSDPVKNLNQWVSIEAQYDSMMLEKGGQNLVDLDMACEDIGERLRELRDDDVNDAGAPFCILEDLTTVMKWKFAKGKPRPLWKLLNSNTDASVRNASRSAFHRVVDNDDLKGAAQELCVLKGVGPASASAFLCLIRPDLFAFMDDEVIEALRPGRPRAYTMKVMLEVCDKCRSLADALGEGWTARRVGRALWTAAKLSVSSRGNDDATRSKKDGGAANEDFGDVAPGAKKRKKERKKETTIRSDAPARNLRSKRRRT